MFLPALGAGSDHTRDDALLRIDATYNQSLAAVWHKTLHLDRAARPKRVSAPVRLAHWVVGGTLTGLALAAAGWRRRLAGGGPALFLGLLTVNMLLSSPAGHSHYLQLLLPLVMVMLADAWERGPVPWWLVGLLSVYPVAAALPVLPGLGILHDLGLPMYAALCLWLAGLAALWRRPEPQPAILSSGSCLPRGGVTPHRLARAPADP